MTDNPSSKGGEASAESGHGDVGADDIEKYIGGVDFPTDKNGLINQARSKDAPREVIDLIENFPDREYGGAADVASALIEAKK